MDTGKDWWTQATTTLQNTLQGTTGRAGGHRQGLVDTGNNSTKPDGGLVDTGNNTAGDQRKDWWTQATTL